MNIYGVGLLVVVFWLVGFYQGRSTAKEEGYNLLNIKVKDFNLDTQQQIEQEANQ